MRPALILFIVSTSAIGLAAGAQAQTSEGPAASTSQPSAIEDIVVTARKVNENLQITPVAISALTSEAMERKGLTNVLQLQAASPSLTVSDAVGQPGSATLFIRGQGSTDALIAIDQAVGVYLNGVYSARASGGAFDMVDVRQVEVLRGPQGTLFGRNTTGGAINIIPNAPTGEFEGLVKGSYGNYDSWSAQGMLNVPLVGDQLGVRVAYNHRESGSYGRNLSLGNGLGGQKQDFFRASLKVAPDGMPWSFLVQADYTKYRDEGQITGLQSFTPGPVLGALVAACSGGLGAGLQSLCPVKLPAGTTSLTPYLRGQNGNGYYDVYNNVDTFGRTKTHGISITGNYEFSEALNFKSITAWRGVNTFGLTDNDGSPLALTQSFNTIRQRQFSQEVQLSLTTDRLQAILGGFYFVENGLDLSKAVSVFPLSTVTGFNDGNVRNESKAIYGQFTYHLTDAIRFTGGLRYTKDNRQLKSHNRNVTAAGVATSAFPNLVDNPAQNPFLATFANSFDYFSYTAGLDWQVQQGMFVYGKTSRAYRSGGLNTRTNAAQIPPTSFGPERVTDYEIGGKFDLFDRKVRFNLAAYYSKIDNVQRNIVGSTLINGALTLVSGAANSAAAHIWGGEAELTVVPIENLTLNASVGLTYPEYDRFLNTIDPNPATNNLVNSEFPYTPKQTYSVSADYKIPAEGLGGAFNVHVDYALRSKVYSISLPPSLQETAKIPGYDLLNARIAFQLENPNVELAVYGANLLQEKYVVRLLDVENTPLGITAYGPGRPRTYGVSASYRF